MKSKNIILLVVLVVALWAVWSFSNKPATVPTNDTQLPGESSQEVTDGNKPVGVEEVPNALQGELQASTDKKRGNFMLLLNDSDRVIYLNTSRDFSNLVGKQVQVSIEGSLDDFLLVNIEEM